MLAVLGLVTAQTPDPEPSPTDGDLNIYTVTPGISGFIAFFLLAVVLWFLLRSMGRHMRRVDRRNEGQRAAEQRADEEPAAGDESGTEEESGTEDETRTADAQDGEESRDDEDRWG